MTRRSEEWSPATRQHFRDADAMPILTDLPTATTTAESMLRKAPRRRNRVVRTNAARRALEPFLDVLATGDAWDLNLVATGDFSMLDMILVLLDQAGPSDVTIATYTAAMYDMEVLNRFISTEQIRSFRLVLDGNFRNQKGNNRVDGTSLGTVLADVFGEDAIRTTRSHMKWVTITGGRHTFTIMGSANMNENRRLENVTVSNDPSLAGFYERVADELFDGVRPGWNPDTGAPALERIDPTGTRVDLGRVSDMGKVSM